VRRGGYRLCATACIGRTSALLVVLDLDDVAFPDLPAFSFQILGWTLVLGVIYVAEGYRSIAAPTGIAVSTAAQAARPTV
jgi:hypothetical protein